MKKYIPVILFFLISHIHAENIKSYDLDVLIDVKTRDVITSGIINIDFQEKDTINLVLWKNSLIKEIKYKSKPVKYSFDSLSPSPIIYIPNGRILTIIKPPKSNNIIQLSLSYISNMKGLKGWANSFSEDWIELNYYCAWFPVGLNSRNFNSKIKISIDKEYVITGSGKVSKKKNYWEMNQSWQGFDNVIIASKKLKSKILKEESSLIQTDYCELSELEADSILSGCKLAFHLFEKYFGKKDSTYLKFIIAPFEHGGGYSRKNFVCLRTKHFDAYTSEGIAHEIAHFWWNNAATTTWEDWLNEAFAEYSMLMYVREKFGIEAFRKKIDEYKSRTKNSPAIWGIDRNSPDSYSSLYEKGSLILCELEDMLGNEKFFNLLSSISKSKIATNNDLLSFIEKKLSKETRQWLENKLKNL